MSDWKLRLMTFEGRLPWASHWTATIRRADWPWGRPDIEVETMLEPDRASALNESEKRSDSGFRYKPGVECGRYSNRDEAIEAAKQVFEQHAEVDDRLVSDLAMRVYAVKKRWALDDRVMPNPRNGYDALTEEQWELRGTVVAVHTYPDGSQKLRVRWDGRETWDQHETDEVVRVLSEQPS